MLATPTTHADTHEERSTPVSALRQEDTNGSSTPTVEVSTMFHLDANLEPTPPNVILRSSDDVLFYVHLHKLLASLNGLGGRIIYQGSELFSSEHPLFAPVPENAQVLNVLLHSLYGLSCVSYRPSIETIIAAVNGLKSYGCSLPAFLAPGSPLFQLFLSQAPLRPLEAYTVAAENNLHDLAVAISPHLLSCHLAECPDELAERMGGVYFKRIYALQDGRMRAFREMVLTPPYPHGPTRTCDFENQRVLKRAWAMASAQLAWDARPDLSPSVIGSVLGSLEQHLACQQCKKALATRVREIIVKWSTLDKHTMNVTRVLRRVRNNTLRVNELSPTCEAAAKARTSFYRHPAGGRRVVWNDFPCLELVLYVVKHTLGPKEDTKIG